MLINVLWKNFAFLEVGRAVSCFKISAWKKPEPYVEDALNDRKHKITQKLTRGQIFNVFTAPKIFNFDLCSFRRFPLVFR